MVSTPSHESKRPEDVSDSPEAIDEVERAQVSKRWTRAMMRLGVEARGILPVPPEHRTDTQYSKIFFVWFSMNFNILSFSAGTLGPAVFGLGLRDSCLVILFFNIICAALPSYLATWGPRTGLRQMCQARYSFGYYGVILPCILNLIGMCGFCILNSILGGQTLASVSNGNLSWSVGIVIVAVISLVVSFCGYKVLMWFERIIWFPVLVAFVVALGVSGKHLTSPPSAPATVQEILSFAGVIAGFTITYAPLGSDFTMYYSPDAPSWRIFLYSMLGFMSSIVTIQCLGAACAIAAPTVPSWAAGFEGDNVGGLLAAMLSPVGTFGKILVVLLAINLASNIAATFYSITLNFQILIPHLVVLPRYLLSLAATAVIIPLSLVGAHRFYATLTNFLALLGYWASMFCAVVLVEHFVFKRNDFSAYDYEAWNTPSKLPTGLAALGACLVAVGVIIPAMEQVWWTGPIGNKTGDIGFELAFFVAALVYPVTRSIELKVRGL
ncbi:NCS cytosine-purine permease [Thelephora terrestris]|uniref:NCS cytosine-purine permease n=1 Tax=Thelephora terrestris TaxID=56493 RepID=A0A9P6L9A6_9AGAM|nr:NCS cytosine-purine permease [Thelephora terrestris]